MTKVKEFKETAIAIIVIAAIVFFALLTLQRCENNPIPATVDNTEILKKQIDSLKKLQNGKKDKADSLTVIIDSLKNQVPIIKYRYKIIKDSVKKLPATGQVDYLAYQISSEIPIVVINGDSLAALNYEQVVEVNEMIIMGEYFQALSYKYDTIMMLQDFRYNELLTGYNYCVEVTDHYVELSGFQDATIYRQQAEINKLKRKNTGGKIIKGILTGGILFLLFK